MASAYMQACKRTLCTRAHTHAYIHACMHACKRAHPHAMPLLVRRASLRSHAVDKCCCLLRHAHLCLLRSATASFSSCIIPSATVRSGAYLPLPLFCEHVVAASACYNYEAPSNRSVLALRMPSMPKSPSQPQRSRLAYALHASCSVRACVLAVLLPCACHVLVSYRVLAMY